MVPNAWAIFANAGSDGVTRKFSTFDNTLRVRPVREATCSNVRFCLRRSALIRCANSIRFIPALFTHNVTISQLRTPGEGKEQGSVPAVSAIVLASASFHHPSDGSTASSSFTARAFCAKASCTAAWIAMLVSASDETDSRRGPQTPRQIAPTRRGTVRRKTVRIAGFRRFSGMRVDSESHSV